MATQFITRKTSRLYEGSNGGSYSHILIFGEEVETSGSISNDRIKVKYRGKYEGYLDTDALGIERSLEVYFIDVGQADAAFIVTPGDKKILVDGGFTEQARNFLAWKYQLADANSPDLEIDLLVLSHADGDHLGGLVPILEHDKIKIKRIIHNGIGLFKGMDQKCGNLSSDGKYLDTLHSKVDELNGMQFRSKFGKWIDLIKEQNIPYKAVSSDTGQIDLDDSSIKMEILGPIHSSNGKLKWFGNHSHTINGHSVFFRLVYDEVVFLFSGDINIEGGEHILEHPEIAEKVSAHVFKTPHHGSHEYHLPFFEAIRPQISVISSGDSPDHGHPRANFLGAIGLTSRSKMPLVFSTEIASAFTEANDVDIVQIIPDVDIRDSDLEAARIFKKRLHGMINVRSDGKDLYAMRRVVAGYKWEAYGPIKVED